ncbi:hypothetical protein Rhopal_004061-T1 [Rhodotorula paludigena]|uniref:Alkaline phosphatase n=1 Tax=Rhodotorula paludigena TaxID=86838 RepID=A0AAV5GNC5_9BASI|nr:hypothetical protein Rhopal_004061-T1 [Rhodotorula paludigena]
MHGSAHVAVRIPTSTEVANARLQPRARPKHWRVVAGGLVLLLGAAYFVTWLLSLGTRFGGQPRMQVILMISDGMGPASETMARSYVQHLASTNSSASAFTRSLLNESVWANLELGYKGRTEGAGRLPLDDILVGTSRTRSSNSLVTDSAAGATAFSCGLKTFNGAIGVTPALAPCGTLLEAAHRQGFATGLVATSRITHATPASFYAHVPDRDLESEIAAFLVGEAGTGLAGPAPVDFAFGGGRCFFIPQSEDGSCRTDETDLLKKAREKGFRVLEGMAALRDFKEEDEDDREGSIIGLFADDHMDYEIDRQGETTLAREQPSLREMATVALRHLSRAGQTGKGKGFFLMIEGSRIDMAGHNNDPVAHVSDMLAYQSTVQYVQQWVDDQNEMGNPTMLISVSDHETGGLALGRQLGEEYPEYPDALANATHSTPYLGDRLVSEYPSATRDWVVSELFEKGLGITDATSEEVDRVWQQRQDAYRANRALADAISRRAQVGWSTAGHSGVDVNLYAFGHNSTGLTGNVENTDIGEHIAHNMGLNLEVVTVELSKSRDRWFDPKAGKEANRTTGLAHYHGDL